MHLAQLLGAVVFDQIQDLETVVPQGRALARPSEQGQAQEQAPVRPSEQVQVQVLERPSEQVQVQEW